jgi:hypothetical protein
MPRRHRPPSGRARRRRVTLRRWFAVENVHATGQADATCCQLHGLRGAAGVSEAPAGFLAYSEPPFHVKHPPQNESLDIAGAGSDVPLAGE